MVKIIDETISDETIVDIVRTKNKDMYIHLVERYQDKLLRYATYLLHDKDKAADTVQQSFIKAYINLNGFNTKQKFSSWIYRITHNEAMNIVKKYHKEIPLAKEYILTDTAIEDFSRKEMTDKAHRCLKSMPLIYGEPLALYYLEDKTYEEISDILRIPKGTVATRLNRAKALMKQLCQKND